MDCHHQSSETYVRSSRAVTRLEQTPVHQSTPAVSQSSDRFAALAIAFLVFSEIGLRKVMARHWRCSCVPQGDASERMKRTPQCG
jgi:hypothetical protein